MLVNTSKQRRADGAEAAETQVAIRRHLRGAHDRGEFPWSRLGEILLGLSRQPRQDQVG